MSHAFPGDTYIFDSRFWNGILPPQGKKYSGYIAKATQGEWTTPEFPVQYRSAEQLYGEDRGAYCFHRASENPRASAIHYHQAVLSVGGYGKLPPILDLEDTRAPANLQSVDHMWVQLQEMEQLSGREVLCYSAQWIWARWARFVQSRHGFYDRMLWEADPEPDTREPGDWTKDKLALIQTRLDFNPGGFNAKIDESSVNLDWWNALGDPPDDDPAGETIPFRGEDFEGEITIRTAD